MPLGFPSGARPPTDDYQVNPAAAGRGPASARHPLAISARDSPPEGGQRSCRQSYPAARAARRPVAVVGDGWIVPFATLRPADVADAMREPTHRGCAEATTTVISTLPSCRHPRSHRRRFSAPAAAYGVKRSCKGMGLRHPLTDKPPGADAAQLDHQLWRRDHRHLAWEDSSPPANFSRQSMGARSEGGAKVRAVGGTADVRVNPERAVCSRPVLSYCKNDGGCGEGLEVSAHPCPITWAPMTKVPRA
jgi:hypothetical protein